jgi:hypothetical protein
MLQLKLVTCENSKSGMSYFTRISHYRTLYSITFFIEPFYTETDRMNMSIKWRTTASTEITIEGSRSRFQPIKWYRSHYNWKSVLPACPSISYRTLRSPLHGSRKVAPPSAFSRIRYSCRGTAVTLLNIEEDVSYNYHVSYYSVHVWLDLEYRPSLSCYFYYFIYSWHLTTRSVSGII